MSIGKGHCNYPPPPPLLPPLSTYTLFTVIHLTVEVNFSAEIISGNDSSVCFNILFTWTPLFSTNGASELLEKNVTACTWSHNVSYSRLASHGAQYRTIHVDTNSTRIILPIGTYSSLLPGIAYIFWLSVSAQLSNETLAHFRSTGTKVEIPSCGGEARVYSLHINTYLYIGKNSVFKCCDVTCCLSHFLLKGLFISSGLIELFI